MPAVLEESPRPLWGLILLMLALAPGSAFGQAVLLPPSVTATNIGLRVVEADPPHDAAPYSVAFRRQGDGAWLEALPLRPVARRNGEGLFAGSVLGLQPDAAYELRVRSERGFDEHLTVRTWPVPTLHPGRRVTVPPGDGRSSLASALARAEPGDVLQLEAGEYVGPFRVSRGGTPSRPITLLGSPDGGTVLRNEGGELGPVIVAEPVGHVVLRDLTIVGRPPAPAVRGGSSRDWTVSGCLVVAGITTGTSGWWIEDSMIVGGHGSWVQGTREKHPGGTGIHAQGSEHTIIHNQLSYFYDGINTARIFRKDLEWAFQPRGPQRSVDIVGNLVFAAQDDGIQVDHVGVNMRVHANRVFWAFAGISFQGFFPGPAYATRNVVTDVAWESWKIMDDSRGIEMFNNSSVSRYGNISAHPPDLTGSRLLNNLLIGRRGLFLGSQDPETLWDHNAYVLEGEHAKIRWSDDGGTDWRIFPTLGAFASETGHERAGVVISPQDDLSGLLQPSERGFVPAAHLAPTGDSALRGAGVPIPTVTTGVAADIGALDGESDPPRYGPRRVIAGALARGYYEDLATLRLTMAPVGYRPLTWKERFVRFIDVNNISVPQLAVFFVGIGIVVGIAVGWLMSRLVQRRRS